MVILLRNYKTVKWKRSGIYSSLNKSSKSFWILLSAPLSQLTSSSFYSTSLPPKPSRLKRAGTLICSRICSRARPHNERIPTSAWASSCTGVANTTWTASAGASSRKRPSGSASKWWPNISSAPTESALRFTSPPSLIIELILCLHSLICSNYPKFSNFRHNKIKIIRMFLIVILRINSMIISSFAPIPSK